MTWSEKVHLQDQPSPGLSGANVATQGKGEAPLQHTMWWSPSGNLLKDNCEVCLHVPSPGEKNGKLGKAFPPSPCPSLTLAVANTHILVVIWYIVEKETIGPFGLWTVRTCCFPAKKERKQETNLLFAHYWKWTKGNQNEEPLGKILLTKNQEMEC